MELFDRLKSLVGIGKARVELSEVTSPIRAGGQLRACVTIRGGDYPVTVTELRVHVDEERLNFTAHVPDDFRPWEERTSFVIPLNRSLARQEVITLPVAIPLPAELEPTDTRRRYVLVADAEIPGLNPKHVAVVEVVA